MNGLTDLLGTIVVIAVTLVVYIIVVQFVNDPACAALDRSITPIFGKPLIEFLTLCWW